MNEEVCDIHWKRKHVSPAGFEGDVGDDYARWTDRLI
jgi:hypothetical protein